MRVMAEQFAKINGRVAKGRRRSFTWGQFLAPVAIVAVLGAALATAPTRSPWTAPPQLTAAGEQVHYLPFDAQQFYDTLKSEYTTLAAQDVRLISSIVSSRAGNIVAIDHWEDGYDADPVNSPGATTEVSTMDAGEVQVLDNVIVLANIGDITPGGSGQAYYDGRDKIVSTSPTVVTMGGWGDNTGSVHAGASAVPEVSRYGYQFQSPVGEDTPYDPDADATDDSPWEYTGLIVQAAQDGTTVTVAGGAPITLDQGEVHLVDGGIDLGDTVNADKPVSVYLATGDIDHQYEGRMYELTPTERWTDTYFSPVTSMNGTNLATRVFFYNPGGSAISVDYTQSDGSTGTIPVGAGAQASYRMPTGVGASFTSGGDSFYALALITQPTASGTDDSAGFNWGFSLIPEAYLTPMVVLGYAPGSSDLSENLSAVWVAPRTTTTVYIDRDGDTSTGVGIDTNGNHYDFSCSIPALAPRLIADDGTTNCYATGGYSSTKGSGDGDMTGARIYTLDGTSLAAAWGQVPGIDRDNPAIDMGTTVLPFPTVDLTKSSEIVDDDGDGLADPGETIRYTISATNAGITPVDNLLVTDEIPDHTSYVLGTTVHNGSGIADDGSGTPFPLDGAGTTLPPALNVGQTRTVTFDVLVDDPLAPTVTEIVNEATLATSYGTYTAVDVQPVAPPAPEISLAKTVYAGHDAGASCQGADRVAATAGAPVTYCFAVTNEGNITLSPVTLEDLDLGIDESDVANVIGDLNSLGSGETAIVYYEAAVAGDLTNTASVTGTAVDGNGDPVPALDPVTASDTAEVDEVAPSLAVSKTIYRGHDDGVLCAGAETAVGVNGDPVTYCFSVTNTGDTSIAPVTLNDPDLGIDQTDMEVLTGDLVQIDPGDTVVLYYEATLDGDLTNTATASGTPSDPNGDPLPGLDPVDDDDTADADEVHPALSVAKTAYAGHDAGASCQGNNLVNALNGEDLTWCFVVTNDGDTELAPVTLDDGDLGITEADMTVLSGALASLAPGDSVALYFEGVAAGDLTNTVTATGVPADGSSDPLPGITPVTDDDDASVDTVGPAVTVHKTVYRGHDAGAGCDGVENLAARNGEDVTWCFAVTNSGDTDLSPVTLTDADLGIDQDDLALLSGDLDDLPTGETAVLYLEGTVDGDLHNTATVTGVPVDGNGDPLTGIDEVTDDDDATVDEVAPAVSVAKTVYRGHDSGAGCPGGELVNAANGGAVTWCFTITNDGDTRLSPVELTDLDLGIIEADLTLLSGDLAGIDPGDSVVAYYEGTVDGDVTNNASVTGTPTDPGGTPLPGVDPVTDDDTAEVDEVGPLVEVAKTVYAGHDGGANCPGSELQRGAAGAEITYCFVVTNSGDTDLSPVTLTDADLGIGEVDMDVISGDLGLVAPGDSVVLAYETTLDGDLVNDVTTTATAVDDQGDPFDGIDPVTDDDTAEVQEVTPSIAVTKGIYAGQDTGASCPGAGNLVAVDGDPVTYCFTVVNNGGATLAPVTVADPQLNIDEADMEVLSGDLASMAPGATTVLYYETNVVDDLVNTATATGTPRDGDDPLPGSDDVSDDDEVTLDEVAPAVSVAKTVYQGHDAGASCQGENLVRASNGSDVTWCFAVTNDGDTNLTPVTLADVALDIDEADLTVLSGDLADLAVGETALLYVEGTVTGTLTNTVEVTGTPADAAGDAYPGLEEVTAQDDATVEQIAPSVSVAKTVYKGHDGGAACPGDELVQGVTGIDVTYCFVVTNDGVTTLDDVTVTDAELGDLTQDDLSGDTAALASMAPGDSAVLFFETTLDGDLVNTAVATGTPVDDQGDPFIGVDPVTDDDTAEVDDVSPSIAVDKSVYAGHDGGSSCAGSGNLVARNGDEITYCFVITNEGEATLEPVTFSDPLLGLTEANVSGDTAGLASLAPGDSVTLYVETDVDGDLTNTAIVTGTPVDGDGDPLPGSDPVTDEDVATVDEVAPAVSVAKTVYLGHDDGAGCASGVEQVHGRNGDAVTWCFVVTNDGDTPLAPIDFADADLDIDGTDLTVIGAGDLDSLDPQESVTLYVEGSVDGDLPNTATVTGTPVDGNGVPLPEVPDVTDEDTAEVVEVAPAVSVAKTVYQGHDDGVGCAGGESVAGIDGDPVTYCFEVTNTGDTTLSPVALDDQTLGIADGAMEVASGSLDALGIGESAVLYYETTMTGDLTNTVTATGTPTDGQGDPLPGVDDVTDRDTAEVQEVGPGISVSKTVARGHDDGANCTGSDVLAGRAGEDITWCFVVTNDGDTTLAPVTLADGDLGIDETDLTVVGAGDLASLAPDQSVTLYLDGVIDGDLTNTATVTGTPSDGQGDPLPGVDDVTDSDDAQVDEVAPSVTIAKTVYRGHDGGTGCEGSNLVTGENGDEITYCFVITNDGDTRLAPVAFADPALSIVDAAALGGDVSALDSMDPGDSVTVYHETTVNGDLTNTATVTGSPADGNGDPLAGVDDVTDSDDAVVDGVGPAVMIAKTVYGGHDDGVGCEGDELLTAPAGDEATWCFVVTNNGDTVLADVSVVDDDLDITDADLSGDTAALASLEPGDTAVLWFEGTVTDDLVNTVTATGTPVDAQGEPLGVDDPSDSDTAEVDVIEPSVTVSKTVYQDHDGGASCPGTESVAGVEGRDVTWCFVVTNDGDTRLAPVTLDDAELGVDEGTLTVASGDLSAMDPGDSAVLYYEGVVDGDIDNTAIATGTPVDDTGTPLPQTEDVTDDDTASVDEIDPALTLLTEVSDPLSGEWYDADADGATLGSNDGLPATLRAGDTASFRFTVTNTGDVGITDVVVDAPQCDEAPVVASGDSINSGVLDVGEVWVLSCTVSDITSGFVLDAAVSGESADGPAGGSDDHEVAEVQLAAITLEKLVLDPDTGDFVDLATVEAGADATFEIVVTNSGEAPLDAIFVTDELGPDCARDFTDVLEPGDSFAAYTCVVSGVEEGFINLAVATGTPVDGAGSPVGVDVTDEDAATVDTATDTVTDLAITKDLVGVDNTDLVATWQVTVTNVGGSAATEPIIVTDELGDDLQYRDASGDGWTCEFVDPTLTCVTDADLAVGGSTSFTIETYVVGDSGDTVTNVARVDGIEDTNEDNNTDDDVVDVVDNGLEPVIPGTLPRTGSDIAGLVLAAGLLIVTGAGLRRWSKKLS